MLNAVAKDIWTVEQAQKFMGAELGTRMTVVRLRDGSLLIHSPVRLNADIKKDLQSLGQVRYVIAPNCYHHLYAGEYTQIYPEAKLYGAPGLQEKRPDLPFEAVIETGTRYPWSTDLEHIICQGMPKLNEVALLHRNSRTLILSDLAFHFDANSTLSARIFARLTGMYGRLAFSWLDKLLFVRDRREAAESIHKILDWDFDRVIIAHGRIIEHHGKEAFRQAHNA